MRYKIPIVLATVFAAAAFAQDRTPTVPPTPTLVTPTPQFTPPIGKTPVRGLRPTPDAEPTPTPPSRTPGPGGDLDREPAPTPTATPSILSLFQRRQKERQ